MKDTAALLEFDESKEAVISPSDSDIIVPLPERMIFAFLGDEAVEASVEKHGGHKAASFFSVTKTFDVFVMSVEGEEIGVVAAPAGAASAVMLLELLIGCGARKILAVGSCGCLTPMEENVFLVPVRALRDEGTSFHYMKESRFIEADKDVLKWIEKGITEAGYAYQECITWTTDAFFRETADKIRKRREEGCTVVEMECSALLACAAFRNVSLGQILYTADSLANTEEYDIRDFGRKSRDTVMELCIRVILGA